MAQEVKFDRGQPDQRAKIIVIVHIVISYQTSCWGLLNQVVEGTAWRENERTTLGSHVLYPSPPAPL